MIKHLTIDSFILVPLKESFILYLHDLHALDIFKLFKNLKLMQKSVNLLNPF